LAGNAAMTIFIGGDNSDFLRKWESTKRTLKKGLGSGAIQASENLMAGFAGLTAAMGALGVASVKMAGDMQANKRAFSTLLGDSKKAEDFLADLAQFAAETPFELPGLVSASKKLLAFGFQAQDIIPMMASIGDAAAMLGMGQEGIDRLTLAIGQMQAKGKVSGEEMRQLAEAGVPAWKFLADAIGVSIPEAMDKAEKGAIDSTTGINAILMGMQDKFKGRPVKIIYYNPKSIHVFCNSNWRIRYINFEQDLGLRRWGRINKYHDLAIITHVVSR
jgi:tape measure domain-containing protein